jgi:protein-tyrosine-phosphatase
MAPLGSASCQYGQIVGKKARKDKRSVLFVCAANQCRSPMAMVMFTNIVSKKKTNLENWRIESAGIWAISGYSATDFAIQTVKDMGLELKDHTSQPVTESLLNGFKLVLCMENEQVAFLKRNFPDSKEKVYLLSEMAAQKKEIMDPAGYSLDSYKDTAKEMLLFLEKGFPQIFELSK